MTNRYYIQQRVLTPAHVFEELVVDGYRFCPFEHGVRGGFLVKCDVLADHAVQSYRLFIAGLAPILDAISVVTQCAVHATLPGSFCIYRRNDNPANVSFLHDAREMEAVGMVLGEEELKDVKKLLENVPDSVKTGLSYLAEANRSSTPKLFLAMLVIAVEAIAGKATRTTKCERCGFTKEYASTDKQALKDICGIELYDPIYRKKPLRHKLFHGGPVDSQLVADIDNRLYERILLAFLKPRYRLEAVERIVAAPRNISYEYSRIFVSTDGVPDLLALEEASRTHELKIVDAPAEY